jgi:hypothetical protein
MAVSIGIQLYTVRDACQKDFKGTLKALAEMGVPGCRVRLELRRHVAA